MKIGFIGTGNMGGAILKGYAASEASEGNEIFIHNRSSERNFRMVNRMKNSIGDDFRIKICNDNSELAEMSDVIIIGVKPSDVRDVLKDIAYEVDKTAKETGNKDKIIVSMAAGVTLSQMEEMLSRAKADCGTYAKIIRVMPNTPAQIGEAMTSISRNRNVLDEDMSRVMEIFNAVGKCIEVPEDMIDCVIGVSGSSTAYTYMYIQALVEAAVANGMDEVKAREFAAQAVIGAAKVALESDESLITLRERVCSPGGTTIEAVNKLIENGFMDDVKEGFQAAVDKSKEMTK